MISHTPVRRALSALSVCTHTTVHTDVPAPIAIDIAAELSRPPTARLRRNPRFQFVIRCIFLIAHERSSAAPSGISKLPKDALVLIFSNFFAPSAETPEQRRVFELALDAPRVRAAIRKRAVSKTQMQVLPLQP